MVLTREQERLRRELFESVATPEQIETSRKIDEILKRQSIPRKPTRIFTSGGGARQPSTPSPKPKPKTPAQLTGEQAKEIREVTKETETPAEASGRFRERLGITGLTEAQAKGVLARRSQEQEIIRRPEEVERRIEMPISEVQPAQRPSRFEEFRLTQETRGLRGERISVSDRISLSIASVIGRLSKIPGETVGFGRSLIKEPITTVKAIPGGIKTTGTEFFRELETPTPEIALGKLGAEVLFLKGTGKAISATGKAVTITRTRLSPKFKPLIEEGGIKKIRGVIEKDIELAGPVKQIQEPLTKQVKLAGQDVTAISAQTDFLTPILKRQRVLDRPLFFDPRGRLRVSRIDAGGKKQASILDILSDDVTFRKGRKQALVVEKAQVEAFPKSLKDIEKSLKSSRGLTPTQQRRLLRFQETPSGKFKPIGFLSKEPEITLSPGERVKRGKVLGVTLIESERVEFIRPEIVKRKKVKGITKAKRPGIISDIDLKRISTSSEKALSKTFVSPTRLSSSFLSGISRVSKRGRVSKKVSPKKVSKKVSKPVSIKRFSPSFFIPSIPKGSLRKRQKAVSPRVIRKAISPKIPRGFVRPLLPPPPIFRSKKVKLKKKDRDRITSIEDIGISEGFTARAIGLKPIKIQKKDIPKIAKKTFGLGLRRFVVVKNKKRKR